MTQSNTWSCISFGRSLCWSCEMHSPKTMSVAGHTLRASVCFLLHLGGRSCALSVKVVSTHGSLRLPFQARRTHLSARRSYRQRMCVSSTSFRQGKPTDILGKRSCQLTCAGLAPLSRQPAQGGADEAGRACQLTSSPGGRSLVKAAFPPHPRLRWQPRKQELLPPQLSRQCHRRTIVLFATSASRVQHDPPDSRTTTNTTTIITEFATTAATAILLILLRLRLLLHLLVLLLLILRLRLLLALLLPQRR